MSQSITLETFVEQARTAGWSRRQVRDELYKLERPDLYERRDEALVALGFAPTDKGASAGEQRKVADEQQAARLAAENARRREEQEAVARKQAEEQAAAVRAAITDGAVIWCDAAANKTTRVVNSYGKKMTFNNAGHRVGLVIDTPAGRFTTRAVNTKTEDQFAAECYSVLKAVELARDLGLTACVIRNDRIGGFEATTKRGYQGTKYLFVAQKIATESGIAVTFDRCSGEENEADHASRTEA